ncbi:MAG: hypothetical protein CM15mP77_1520 [Synechococcus sp.]|nr:MAG: hypothetical protein CM15mP77_1520 [Synechococcus sp.]
MIWACPTTLQGPTTHRCALLARSFDSVGQRIGSRFLVGLVRRAGADDLQQLCIVFPFLRTVVWAIGTLAAAAEPWREDDSDLGFAQCRRHRHRLGPERTGPGIVRLLDDLLDNPSPVGQFISVGSTSATVERIGVRSTTLRSLRGEQVVMSNSPYRLHHPQLRRNGATPDDLFHRRHLQHNRRADEGNPNDGSIHIDAQEHSTFNRCHFTEFADSSLNFELVYYIDTRDSPSPERAASNQPWNHGGLRPSRHRLCLPEPDALSGRRNTFR